MFRLLSQYASIRALVLFGAEAGLIVLCLLAAVRLRFWGDAVALEMYMVQPKFALQAVAVAICFLLACYCNELYDSRICRHFNTQLTRLLGGAAAGCVLLTLLYYAVPSLHVGRGLLFFTSVFFVSSVAASRWVVDAVWHSARRNARIAVVGTGKLAQDLAREIQSREDLPLQLVGFIQPHPSNNGNGFTNGSKSHPLVLGSVQELSWIVQSHRLDRIIVSLEDRRNRLPLSELLRLRTRGLKIEDAHTAIALLTGRVFLQSVRPSWFIFTDGFHRHPLKVRLKRAIDILLSLIGLTLSAPIMALAALWIRLDSRGPVLYRQRRVGLEGRCFSLLKFRTMVPDAEVRSGPQWAQRNDPRITRVGRWLRHYRIDEMPQFFNVLMGEMSLVGPRPERPEFLAKIREEIPFYDERHTVRPGITGWAQVRYPYGASMQDSFRKLEYDLFYLKHMSFAFDCHILLRTVKIVFMGRGAR